MSLRKELDAYNPSNVVKSLKKPTPETTVETQEKGQDLLKFAAREGYLEVTLWLLNAGVEIVDKVEEIKWDETTALHQEDASKTALYWATERGHNLLAKTLRIFGAEKESAIKLATQLQNEDLVKQLTPDVIVPQSDLQALVLWSVSHYRPVYGTKMLEKLLKFFNPKEKEAQEFMGAMIELAAYYNFTAVVKKLLEHYSPRVTNQCTAGYWAIINGKDELYNLVCTDEAAKVRSLQQVKHYRPQKSINAYIVKESPEAQARLRKEVRHAPPEIVPAFDGQTTDQIRLAQNAATSGSHLDALRMDCAESSVADITCLVRNALAQKNYVQVMIFCAATDTARQQEIFVALLPDRELATQFIFAADVDMCAAATRACAKQSQKDFFTFLFPNEELGILFQMVKRHTQLRDTVNASERVVRKTLFHAGNSINMVNIILRCMYDFTMREDIRRPLKILINLKNLPLQARFEHLRGLNVYKAELRFLEASVGERMERFGQSIEGIVFENSLPRAKNGQKLPRAIWNSIFEFNDLNTRAAIGASCRFFSSTITDPHGNAANLTLQIKNELEQKEAQLEQIDRFVSAVDAYLAAEQTYFQGRSYCDHRFSKPSLCNTILILLILATSISIIISSRELSTLVPAKHHADDLFSNTFAPNTTTRCENYFSKDCTPDELVPIVPALCLALCESFYDLNNTMGNWFLILIIGSIIPCTFTSSLLLLNLSICEGATRFNSLSITEFSPTVVNAARTMVNLAATHFPDDDGWLTIPSSQLRQTATQARATELSRKEPLSVEIETLRRKVGKLPYVPKKIQDQSAAAVVHSDEKKWDIDVSKQKSAPSASSSFSSSAPSDRVSGSRYGALDEGLTAPLLTDDTNIDSSADVVLDVLSVRQEPRRPA